MPISFCYFLFGVNKFHICSRIFVFLNKWYAISLNFLRGVYLLVTVLGRHKLGGSDLSRVTVGTCGDAPRGYSGHSFHHQWFSVYVQQFPKSCCHIPPPPGSCSSYGHGKSSFSAIVICRSVKSYVKTNDYFIDQISSGLQYRELKRRSDIDMIRLRCVHWNIKLKDRKPSKN